MKRLLLSLFAWLVSTLSANAQDSLHYSVFWAPTHAYQKAGVKQEGVFLYRYKKGILSDSLIQQSLVYDSLGRVVRSEDYQRNKLLRRYHYFYSGSQLDSLEQDELWLRAKLVHRYSYDEAGNLILKQVFNGKRKTIQERYVYNSFRQPLKLYLQIENLPEELVTEFSYRKDRLIQQIHHWFEGSAASDFSYLYTYPDDGRSSKRFFQRRTEEKRFVDCFLTYNEKNQLVEKIIPPLPKSVRPPEGHSRPEEVVETYSYYPNGMLNEVQTKINDQLISVRKHIYFY